MGKDLGWDRLWIYVYIYSIKLLCRDFGDADTALCLGSSPTAGGHGEWPEMKHGLQQGRAAYVC